MKQLTPRERIKSYQNEITYDTKVIKELLDFIEENKNGFSAEYIHEKYIRIKDGGENLVICHQNIYNIKRELEKGNLQ